MNAQREAIEDRVIDFFAGLFRQVFYSPFAAGIESRLKRNKVERAVADAADAASQAITRLLLNERLAMDQVEAILGGLEGLAERLDLKDIGNANIAPESIAEGLLRQLGQPDLAADERLESIYRVTLHSIVVVLTHVGPVMVEWRKVGFAETFEVLRRVIDRLNRMSEQLDVLGRFGQEAADQRFELSYRDYLMQRFHRVEAGTVKMTTNLNVDLRELFVMPRVQARKGEPSGDQAAIDALMDLSAARKRFAQAPGLGPTKDPKNKEKPGLPALDLFVSGERSVIVGTPGSGKSTLFEWVQIQIAWAEVDFVLAGKQAIPLLLRVRQLDPERLPTGSDLIAAATASGDLAKLAPGGWMDRMMRQGRVLFMLDGLDEVEPRLLHERVLPWLGGIIDRYADCRYLISSRPSGYPRGTLKPLRFAEADLLDFDADAIAEYTRHWCVAVRLGRNELEEEARREGAADGDGIVRGFRDHPYINDLARSPLMLSAICLVNWFEGGKLPADRAMLYRLCVEGLLHHWDQRRGIHSDYSLDEKLRVSRELAIAMQADDRAEYESDKVLAVFAAILGDGARAEALLEHIRYRTGLLIERRPAVFAFAHLTFQEYLAAQAIHEGNRRGITMANLVEAHSDPRWREVIPLYAGSGTDAAARSLIDALMSADDSGMRGELLADAYLASERGLKDDKPFREGVLGAIAGSAAGGGWQNCLNQFPASEVAPVANAWLGRRVGRRCVARVSGAFQWLEEGRDAVDKGRVLKKILNWREIDNPVALSEVVYIAHLCLTPEELNRLSSDTDLYRSEGPRFDNHEGYACQGAIAIIALSARRNTKLLRMPRGCILTVLDVILHLAMAP